MNDEEIYYFQKDHGHETENEISDSIMYCVLACIGLFSWLCIYLVRNT